MFHVRILIIAPKTSGDLSEFLKSSYPHKKPDAFGIFSEFLKNFSSNCFSDRIQQDNVIYRTRAIIGRSRFEAAFVYKPRILGLKNEEFPFLVHKLSLI